MLIDAHNHPNWHGHDADRILADMEQHGIDLMWLFDTLEVYRFCGEHKLPITFQRRMIKRRKSDSGFRTDCLAASGWPRRPRPVVLTVCTMLP